MATKERTKVEQTIDGEPAAPTGEDCPVCPHGSLVEPDYEGARIQCPRCAWIEADANDMVDLRNFDLTYRQARRFVRTFGYDGGNDVRDVEHRMLELCHDAGVNVADLDALFRDLRGDLQDEDHSGREDGGHPPWCQDPVVCGFLITMAAVVSVVLGTVAVVSGGLPWTTSPLLVLVGLTLVTASIVVGRVRGENHVA